LNLGKSTKRFAIACGFTWSDEHKDWRSHQSLGATVTKAPKGWQKLFDPPAPARRLLKVVSIVYDWKLYTDGDYERKGGDF